MSIDQYLDRTVFTRPRSFTPEDFRQFMYGCSKPLPESIAVARDAVGIASGPDVHHEQ